MINRVYIIILFLTTLSGCKGPSGWAEHLESNLQCGMSIEEVQDLTSKKIIKQDVPREWVTHLIRDNNTDLRLGFKNGKLYAVQIAWAQKMMKIATYQKVNLCQDNKLK